MCTAVGVHAGEMLLGGIVALAWLCLYKYRGIRRSTIERHATFLADVAHELQTPIAILRGNLEILEMNMNADGERVAHVMRVTIDSMARLVAESLESASLEFSKKKIAQTVISVRKLLDEVIEDCTVLAEYNEIKISAMSEDLSVMGDRGKLKEVLLNLVSNAFKYTSRGGSILLRARQRETMVQIVVEDTGCGIASQDIEHIFERFYRIADDHSSGTGIGLYLCRQIIEAHHGTVSVKSEVGVGSRFFVHLPIYLL